LNADNGRADHNRVGVHRQLHNWVIFLRLRLVRPSFGRRAWAQPVPPGAAGRSQPATDLPGSVRPTDPILSPWLRRTWPGGASPRGYARVSPWISTARCGGPARPGCVACAGRWASGARARAAAGVRGSRAASAPPAGAL